MKPKTKSTGIQLSLTKVPLHSLISMEHHLVKLASNINWKSLEEHFGAFYKEKGRPAINTRLMISLHYLKYLNDLSDKEVLMLWIENPYWQYFSGMEFFEHKFPIDSSSMTRWRKRIAKEGAEELLKETIHAGLKLKVIKISEIKDVNVDTTVQEKDIRFPTDARLYHRSIVNLVAQAKKEEVVLRQTYTRISKRLLRQQQKFSNARRPSEAKNCTKKLKTILGRIIRDIKRKIESPSKYLSNLLEITEQIRTQEKCSKNKIYSVHEPSVNCIAKGKVHKKYEFCSKVSIASTNKSNFILGALSFDGNPHDGKTLKSALEQIADFGLNVENVFVDKGYRGHGIKKQTVHICSYSKKKQGNTIWTKVKRRAAIEPVIGHLKSEHKLGRNRLAGDIGDTVNVLLSCVAFNLKKLLNRLKSHLVFILGLIKFMLCQPYQELAQHKN